MFCALSEMLVGVVRVSGVISK